MKWKNSHTLTCREQDVIRLFWIGRTYDPRFNFRARLGEKNTLTWLVKQWAKIKEKKPFEVCGITIPAVSINFKNLFRLTKYFHPSREFRERVFYVLNSTFWRKKIRECPHLVVPQSVISQILQTIAACWLISIQVKADWLSTFDVMDGVVLSNISFGATCNQATRRSTQTKTFDVHLMIGGAW